MAIVPLVGGIFFPQRTILRLDNHGYSPTLLRKITEAGARLQSFADAAFALNHLAGISISTSQVQRITTEIGQELVEQRDRTVESFRRRELPARPENPPQAVAVEMDGGRVRTRAVDKGPGVHHAQHKEDKVACLVRLESQTFDEDPQPDPPETFLQPRRVRRLVGQMQGASGKSPQESEPKEPEPEELSQQEARREAESERTSPKKLVRSCVASMATSKEFGPMVAAEAQQRGFFDAKRQAFVGDGAEYNWTIQRGYFKDFVPIVDFLHVLCYLYAAARSVREDERENWLLYERWLRLCWQGRVTEVIEDLQSWRERLGEIGEEEDVSATDVRVLVKEAWNYLSNNQSRMDYPRYRRRGLPVTSSLVESLVGEVNARVKSKQKYWNRQDRSPTASNCEAILQVRAALLSEDERLERFFQQRPGNVHRRRRVAA